MTTNAETKRELIRLFKTESTIAQHVEAHAANPDAYASELLGLISSGVAISAVTKARAAAIMWQKGDRATVKTLLFEHNNSMTIVEVLGMVKILDSGRKAARIEKKITKHARMKLTKRLALTKEAKALRADGLPGSGTGASGALMKQVRKWIGKIDKSALEFFLLARPKEPWKELADLCHTPPSAFQLDYFLPSVFGEAAPAGSITAAADECNSAADIHRLLAERPSLAQCYSWLRNKFPPAGYSAATKEALARAIPLEEALWYYEELAGGQVDHVLTERIAAGEALGDGRGKANFGKLMERMLLFKRRNAPFADMLTPRAEELLLELGAGGTRGKTVAVLGDASSSMQVAIDAAAIIAASVCSCFSAELSFFSTTSFPPHLLPRSAAETLEVAHRVKAGGCTANAASLLPYFKEKRAVDLFVMVTDEEENTQADGMFFDEMFERYVNEVYPHAKLVFVSFIRPTDPGHMVSKLRKWPGMDERVTQFKFDSARPDLSKLSSLLGIIAAELHDVQAMADEDEVDADATEKMQALHVSRVQFACLDGQVSVSAGAAEALQRAFPHGTESVPAATLRGVLPALLQQTCNVGSEDA